MSPSLYLQLNLPELHARLNDLLALRLSGEEEVRTRTLDAEEMVRFRDDKALAAAIADCERRIAKLSGSHVRTILISTSKGL